MAPILGSPVLDRLAAGDTDPDLDFTLDIRPVEAALPVAELLRSTSDNCGSTCSGSACTSFTDDPA